MAAANRIAQMLSKLDAQTALLNGKLDAQDSKLRPLMWMVGAGVAVIGILVRLQDVPMLRFSSFLPLRLIRFAEGTGSCRPSSVRNASSGGSTHPQTHAMGPLASPSIAQPPAWESPGAPLGYWLDRSDPRPSPGAGRPESVPGSYRQGPVHQHCQRLHDESCLAGA